MPDNRANLPELYYPPTDQSEGQFGEDLRRWDPGLVAHLEYEQQAAPTVHILLAAGLAASKDGPVHIMVSAEYLDPTHSPDPALGKRRVRDYCIETFNALTGEYLYYLYIPHNAQSSRQPEEITGYAVLDQRDPENRLQQTGSFGFHRPETARTQLAPVDMVRIHEYLEAAKPNVPLLKRMEAHLLRRLPQAYRHGQKPPDNLGMRLAKAALRRLLNQ